MTTRYEQQKRRQRDNNLVCWLSAALGMVLIVWWVAASITHPGTGGGIVAWFGVLLIVLGIVFMGRKPRNR